MQYIPKVLSTSPTLIKEKEREGKYENERKKERKKVRERKKNKVRERKAKET